MAAARLRVSVASPDAARAATRGLAAWLVRVAPATARGEVSVAIISDRRMRSLNRQFRGVDKATDVLSFPAEGHRPTAGAFLGDVAIANGIATRQAHQAGHSIGIEIRVLALHGLLHLLGYDHETDNGRMARLETRLRKRGGLSHGLTERRR